MPRNVRRFLIVLVVANLGVVAWGHFVPRDREMALYSQLMQGLDDNHDGRISREEFLLHLGDAEEFEAYDLNHDGALDLVEFRRAIESEDPDAPAQGGALRSATR